MKKILPFNGLTTLSICRGVGLCHGCWDILHIGHIRHLQWARAKCAKLVVTVTADRFVNKAFDQPVFPAEIRAEVLAALACVDFVAINDNQTAVEVIRALKPDWYFKGMEYSDHTPSGLLEEENEITRLGGNVIFIGDTLASSTKLAGRLS